jgi:hypothetical protein
MIGEHEELVIEIDDSRYVSPIRIKPEPVYMEDGTFSQTFKDIVVLPAKAYKV